MEVEKMKWLKTNLTINTQRQGLHDFTGQINAQIANWQVNEGMAFLFVQHTSASLVINENYDSSAKRDLERFFDHIAPENERWVEHTIEGQDDSPAHMRTMITPTSMTIPVDDGKLNLGTWQGVFLAEHRHRGQQRQVVLRVLSMD
jgi:secondary thiamine-phosphate synthase enzyme